MALVNPHEGVAGITLVMPPAVNHGMALRVPEMPGYHARGGFLAMMIRSPSILT